MCRIALIGENSSEYVEKLIDIWNSGSCAVLIDCKTPPKTIVKMMFEADVKRCYVERKYCKKIYEFLNKSIELIPYDKVNISAQLLPPKIYGKYQENYNNNEAIVVYSSGTTGSAKGIILSHFAISTNADSIIDYMQPQKNDCIYVARNLTHSSTIIGELLVALKTKTPILIASTVVPPRLILGNIVKYKVTILGLTPILLEMCYEEYRRRYYDLSILKKIYVSGSILSEKTYVMAHKVFCRQEIYNVYGLSEAGPRVTAQRCGYNQRNSVGKVIKGVEIVIVDEYGNIVSNKERGIIHVNTPSKFQGYIQGNIKNKSLYHDWLNTGDLGYFDEDGELYIVGRIDDMIVIAGHKIYPYEIEKQIQRVSNIRECIVTTVKFNEEDILCCLYVSDNRIREDIKNALGYILMKHEIPKIYIRTDKLPRVHNGKIFLKGVKEIILRKLKEGHQNES